MNWYFLVLQRKYSLLNGRSRRREYWWYSAIWSLIFLFLSVVDIFIGLQIPWLDKGPLASLYMLATIVPSIAVSVRRLHDIGLTGWFTLLHLVPYVGALVLLGAALVPGHSGENKYGSPPELDAA